jgi:Na+/melibiose symporter-like transporter
MHEISALSETETTLRPMTKATPEQIRVYRHRRIMMFIGFLCIVIAWVPSVSFLLNHTHNGKVAIAVCFGSVILASIGMMTFKYLYFRCPVCGEPFPYQCYGIPNHCKKCETDFAD